MSNSSLTQRNKGKIVRYSILITVIYLIVFGYLSVRPFEKWVLAPFVDGILGVFMGAGAIAIITGIILVVQSVIESERTKKQKVFDQKLALYNQIIDEMQEVYRIKEDEESQILDAEERMGLYFTQLRVALLSRPKTLQSFSRLVNNLADQDGVIKAEASKLLLDFVIDAREDLDVQQPMNATDQAMLDDAIEIAEKEAEHIRTLGRATYFVGDNPLQQYLDQFSEQADSTLIQTMNDVHDYLVEQFANRDGVSFDYTRTGGLSCFALGKKRGAKFCYLRFEDFSEKPGKPRKLGVHLYLLKSPSNDYEVPRINGLSTHQSWHGFEFFTVKLISPEDFSDEVKSMIAESYKTRVQSEVLKERKSKKELRELAKRDLDELDEDESGE